MQTRSATRIAQALNVCVEPPSITEEGVHISREFSEVKDSENLESEGGIGAATNQAEPTTLDAGLSDNSMFDDTLSSLGSRDLSPISSFEYSPTNSSPGTTTPSTFDRHYEVSEFGKLSTPSSSGIFGQLCSLIGPIRTLLGRSPRALQRSPVKRWKRDAKGNFTPADDDHASLPRAVTRPLDSEEIFDRELARMINQREVIAASLTVTFEEEDMDGDAAQILTHQVASASTTKKIDPYGTEIIEESVIGASEEVEYPQQWVQRQSRGLRSFPTETML